MVCCIEISGDAVAAVMLGTGFVVLVVVWVVCLVLCIAFSRLDGAASYAGIVAILAAVVVTLALWFHPRGHAPAAAETRATHDSASVVRNAVVSVLALMLVVGVVVVGVFHVFDERRARPVKPWTYS